MPEVYTRVGRLEGGTGLGQNTGAMNGSDSSRHPAGPIAAARLKPGLTQETLDTPVMNAHGPAHGKLKLRCRAL